MLTRARTLSFVLAAFVVGGAATACGGGSTEPPLAAPPPVPSSVAPREGAPVSSVASGGAVGVVQAPPTWRTTAAGAVPTTAFRDADVCNRLRATRSWASAPGRPALAGSGDACVWETAPGNLRVVLTRIGDARTTVEQYQRTHDVVDVLDGAGHAGLLTVDGDRWTVAVVLDGLLLEVGPAPRPVAEEAARRLCEELERPM